MELVGVAVVEGVVETELGRFVCVELVLWFYCGVGVVAGDKFAGYVFVDSDFDKRTPPFFYIIYENLIVNNL